MIKAITFDMGGVMLAGDIKNVYTHLAKSLGLKKPELILPLLKEHRLGQMSGKISARDFAQIIKENFNLELGLEEFQNYGERPFWLK